MILGRAGNCCEWCEVGNYTIRDGVKIVLTIAHMDHTPENCEEENLKALCQRCHNRYDAPARARNRKIRLEREAGQLYLMKE